MSAVVELQQVVKRFSRRDGSDATVLDRIDLECDAGEALLVEGCSGSGKSTLLNLIAGLYTADEGTVRVAGRALERLSETARDRLRAARIGYVFQTFNLLSPLSALENLHVPAALAGRQRRGLQREARKVLVELGLEDHLDKRPYELSVGQRQRVAIGRALLHRPEVLLADEPTANLDGEAAAQVLSAMKRLCADGTALIIATHDRLVRSSVAGPILNVETGKVRS
ncbi:MAG: ABC transporter ATP-binding protein [Deltaproteobacteria bacterium]|jgi:putative ABC transport system ATP-binding protein|nr:ABC transporter ATP-binding protein [Deltaproteobacteria bacterium]MBW2534305.1 ABC transporter ATP-binding protein [Deltaproteobacteria bacterium]